MYASLGLFIIIRMIIANKLVGTHAPKILRLTYLYLYFIFPTICSYVLLLLLSVTQHSFDTALTCPETFCCFLFSR